jgi:hypothetical protein
MWKYEGELFEDDDIGDYIGFVYIIINHTANKKYIGKKLFTKSKSYQKNKKTKKRRVSSDWKKYYGSNKELIQDVKNGHECSRQILHLCYTKSELNYIESKLIFTNDCLILDEWYNSWISCRINGNTLSHMKEKSYERI